VITTVQHHLDNVDEWNGLPEWIAKKVEEKDEEKGKLRVLEDEL